MLLIGGIWRKRIEKVWILLHVLRESVQGGWVFIQAFFHPTLWNKQCNFLIKLGYNFGIPEQHAQQFQEKKVTKNRINWSKLGSWKKSSTQLHDE